MNGRDGLGMHGVMPISEAKRADLYTGLVEVLGPDRAETLMAYVPRFDPADVATKADLKELRVEFRDGLAAVAQRLDRLSQTLVAGLFVIVAAMIGVVLTVA